MPFFLDRIHKMGQQPYSNISPANCDQTKESSSSQGSLILVPSDLIWRPKQSVEWEARQNACTCQIYFARTDCFCKVLQYHMKIGFCKDVENVCSIFHPCRKTRKASTIPLICVDQFCHCHMEPNWYQGFYKFGKKKFFNIIKCFVWRKLQPKTSTLLCYISW